MLRNYNLLLYILKVRGFLLKTEDLKTNCPLCEEVIDNLWPEHLMSCTEGRFPQDMWKTFQEERIFDQTRGHF